jgi:hypothetical protein
VGLLLPHKLINGVEHFMHDIALLNRSDCRCDKKRIQDQTNSPTAI